MYTKTKLIRLTESDAMKLMQLATLTGRNESAVIRSLIVGHQLKEKPGEDFYQALRDLRSLAVNLNQLTKYAHTIGVVSSAEMDKLIKEIRKMLVDLQKAILLPETIPKEMAYGNDKDMGD